jgi:predicted DNA binding CopG/RHH family protein
MQQTATHSQPPSAADFAGLLAALTGSKPKQETPWNNAELADDVATLTYENALRAHSRYKPAEPADWGAVAPYELPEALETPVDDEPAAVTSQQPQTAAVSRAGNTASRELVTPFVSKQVDSALLDRDRKCASITIRMSKAECVQLRQRAAEAGMSISAYLRSCTFEAESLRAQVKEALAELKCANPGKPPMKKPPARSNPHDWIGRMKGIIPPWRSRQNVA